MARGRQSTQDLHPETRAGVGAIVPGSVWNVVRLGGSGGLLPIPPVHALPKNALAIAKIVDDFRKQEARIEARLTRTLIKNRKEYPKGARIAGTKAVFFKWATGQDNPWSVSIVSSRCDPEMLTFKPNQQYKKALEMSAVVNDGLDALEKPGKEFGKSDLNAATKLLPQRKAMRAALDTAPNQCHAIMDRNDKYKTRRDALEKILNGLEGKGDIFNMGQKMLLSAVIGKGVVETVRFSTGASIRAAGQTAERMHKPVAQAQAAAPSGLSSTLALVPPLANRLVAAYPEVMHPGAAQIGENRLTDPAFYPGGALVAVQTTQPLDRTLDYRAPEGGVLQGAFVAVPLGPRQVLGVVWGPGEGGFDPAKIRAIARVLDMPPMRPEMMAFLTRAGDYTVTAMDNMLRLATRLPGLGDGPAMRRLLILGTGAPDRMTPARERVIALMEEQPEAAFTPTELAAMAGVSGSVVKGLVAQSVLIEIATPRDAPFPPLDPARPGKPLTDDQAAAANALRTAAATRAYGTTLLKGVTGSGKTEVYLEAVAEALARRRQALVLLPEIALTVEFLARVEARFGARPAEWHSGVTQVERRRVWKATAEGRAQLVVGARSALYLPFSDLGLIVVDEEHDSSYKQEDGTLYHARDMAVLRASLTRAHVILASATPSLETWTNARAGKYARLDLPERFGVATLPTMRTLDMREHRPPRGQWISAPLADAVAARLAAGEQALLFLNRRGYAPITQCRACGEQIGCTDCDARLVEHRFLARLVCHQCGASRPMPDACPACNAADSLAAIGPGVERLAEEAAARFPDARIAILSSDLAATARALKARIEEIASGAADLIIGTQMVAKGHNFPLLTLVGVIDADLGLQGGDLRAAEKSFQLIRQVAGRAGRADRPGEAILQSYQPDHPVMAAIVGGDEEAFWTAEAANREAAGAPPFGRMAGIVVSSPDEAQAYEVATTLARNARPLHAAGAQLFGPAAAPIAKVRGRFRVRLLIKADKAAPIQNAIRDWLAPLKPPTNLRIQIDIDPQSFY